MKTNSQAFKFIALAFLQRAAGEGKPEDRELTSWGLCNACSVLRQRGLITQEQDDAMTETVMERHLPGKEEYKQWPARVQRNRNFRGLLALALSYEAKAAEVASQRQIEAVFA